MTKNELENLPCYAKNLDEVKEFGEIQIFKTLSLGLYDFLESNLDDLKSIGLDKFKIYSEILERKDFRTFFPQFKIQPINLIVSFNDETAKFMFNLLLRK
jgi:hypothetical protein